MMIIDMTGVLNVKSYTATYLADEKGPFPGVKKYSIGPILHQLEEPFYYNDPVSWPELRARAVRALEAAEKAAPGLRGRLFYSYKNEDSPFGWWEAGKMMVAFPGGESRTVEDVQELLESGKFGSEVDYLATEYHSSPSGGWSYSTKEVEFVHGSEVWTTHYKSGGYPGQHGV